MSALRLLVLAFVLSASVELLQESVFTYRTAQLRDVVLNVAGALAAGVIVRSVALRQRRAARLATARSAA